MAVNERLNPANDRSNAAREDTPRHRLQLDFSSDAYGRLQEIRIASGCKTNADVVRNALRLYEWYLDQKRNGFSIQITKDDVLKEVEILL